MPDKHRGPTWNLKNAGTFTLKFLGSSALAGRRKGSIADFPHVRMIMNPLVLNSLPTARYVPSKLGEESSFSITYIEEEPEKLSTMRMRGGKFVIESYDSGR